MFTCTKTKKEFIIINARKGFFLILNAAENEFMNVSSIILVSLH